MLLGICYSLFSTPKGVLTGSAKAEATCVLDNALLEIHLKIALILRGALFPKIYLKTQRLGSFKALF
jgi:hypothetical protein